MSTSNYQTPTSPYSMAPIANWRGCSLAEARSCRVEGWCLWQWSRDHQTHPTSARTVESVRALDPSPPRLSMFPSCLRRHVYPSASQLISPNCRILYQSIDRFAFKLSWDAWCTKPGFWGLIRLLFALRCEGKIQLDQMLTTYVLTPCCQSRIVAHRN